MNKKNGFTLVELLIGMAILVSLMVMMIGAINPTIMVSKARDSERKSDLNKIKKAFEEYWNDNGYYPKNDDLVVWNVASNCGKKIDEISKYLTVWPCDPSETPYIMVSLDNWYKVVTNLENKKDEDIPLGWYDQGTYLTSGYNKNVVNYGVSSTNILWYEGEGFCNTSVCHTFSCNGPVGGSCDEKINGACFYESRDQTCNNPVCQVSSCHN